MPGRQPTHSLRSAPSGDAGPDTAVCRCGAPAHPEHPDRCTSGHVVRGNVLALVVGERSRAFWREHDRIYRELREEFARDAGHDSYEDAPAAARVAFDGLAQAAILMEASYRRTVEDGGPLTSQGRTRTAADATERWQRRAEAWARLLGLKRKPQPTPTLAEVLGSPQPADAGDDTRPGAASRPGDPRARPGPAAPPGVEAEERP